MVFPILYVLDIIRETCNNLAAPKSNSWHGDKASAPHPLTPLHCQVGIPLYIKWTRNLSLLYPDHQLTTWSWTLSQERYFLHFVKLYIYMMPMKTQFDSICLHVKFLFLKFWAFFFTSGCVECWAWSVCYQNELSVYLKYKQNGSKVIFICYFRHLLSRCLFRMSAMAFETLLTWITS